MTWVVWCLLVLQVPPSQNPKPKPEVQEELPPEEDVAAKPKEYSFNPLQAENEMKIGAYYMKRGKFRAAAQRFQEATLWNPGLALAYERLGAADDKAHEKKAAREAYAKYLEVAPDAKDADDVRKRMKKL
jgi:tetratricopeptide (TPR) repeat protein